jgi:hypothetical protein
MSNSQDEITIVNLYVTNVGIPNLIKHTQLDLKTQIDPNTVTVRNFNTQLSTTDRLSRPKTSAKNV